uniref:hypothetical protein n=1 Tax=Bradyrhizobium sp. DOA9 TaxID=1126627 RepID=UPI00049994C9|nr:hypothetical protein [Bradyrhizobium sp. DOA9]GAJ37743.1 hypothetical protein BDOA9_0203610 [Bradyrhizobium sp. DOA9]
MQLDQGMWIDNPSRDRLTVPHQVSEVLGLDHLLLSVISPLLAIHENVCQQQGKFDNEVRRLKKLDETTRRLITIPGVSVVTAQRSATRSMPPRAFNRLRWVSATEPYAEAQPIRRNRHNRKDISMGDRPLRTDLFEAATVLLCGTKNWSSLKAWGMKLAKRIGMKKAKVAIARKIVVSLHCSWVDGTSFDWGEPKPIWYLLASSRSGPPDWRCRGWDGGRGDRGQSASGGSPALRCKR